MAAQHLIVALQRGKRLGQGCMAFIGLAGRHETDI